MERMNELRRPHHFGRVNDFVGKGKLIPVSRSTWYSWVKSGLAPKPRMLSARIAVYDMDDILHFLRSAKGEKS